MPRFGSEELVARIWKPRSGSKNDEKTLVLIGKVICWRKIMILATVL